MNRSGDVELDDDELLDDPDDIPVLNERRVSGAGPSVTSSTTYTLQTDPYSPSPPPGTSLTTTRVVPRMSAPSPPPSSSPIASSLLDEVIYPRHRHRDATYIPRPPNAFILFRSAFIRSQKITGKVEGNHSSLSKIIGMYWKALPREEKEVWEAKAVIAQEEHRQRYPDWRFRPGANALVKAQSKSKARSRRRDTKKESEKMDGGEEYDDPGGKRKGKGKAKIGEPVVKPRANFKKERRLSKIADLLVEGKDGMELELAVEEWEDSISKSRRGTKRAAAVMDDEEDVSDLRQAIANSKRDAGAASDSAAGPSSGLSLSLIPPISYLREHDEDDPLSSSPDAVGSGQSLSASSPHSGIPIRLMPPPEPYPSSPHQMYPQTMPTSEITVSPYSPPSPAATSPSYPYSPHPSETSPRLPIASPTPISSPPPGRFNFSVRNSGFLHPHPQLEQMQRQFTYPPYQQPHSRAHSSHMLSASSNRRDTISFPISPLLDDHHPYEGGEDGWWPGSSTGSGAREYGGQVVRIESAVSVGEDSPHTPPEHGPHVSSWLTDPPPSSSVMTTIQDPYLDIPLSPSENLPHSSFSSLSGWDGPPNRSDGTSGSTMWFASEWENALQPSCLSGRAINPPPDPSR